MGDFDLGGFGDLSNYSLGGGDSGGGFSIPSSGFSLSGDAPMGGGGAGGGAGLAPDTLNLDVNPSGGGGGGGLGGFAGLAKSIAPFLQLGTAGVGMGGTIMGAANASQQANLARNAQKLQKQTLLAQQAAATPLTAFGSQQLQQAEAGKIPPQIQAQIDNWAQGAKAKAADYAARSGQGNSTMLTQWNQWIDQQAAAMASDYLQKEQQLGMQGLQSGAQALGGAAANANQLQQGAVQNEGGIAQLMDQANKALASLSAGAA